MAATLEKRQGEDQDHRAGKCLARCVMDAFAADPTLEAVTIDPARETISVATLGQANLLTTTDRVRETIQKTREQDADKSCALLAGSGSCNTCSTPLSPSEQHRITIRQHGTSTTIARVTCPTAPDRKSVV